jgi:NAD(P)-dependent dehydrogenase (short-subunit alcohol dehydrogenase family)
MLADIAKAPAAMNFENKTVFITGATRGIGEAVARAFRSAGARVVGTGTQGDAEGAFDEYVQADFCDVEQIRVCADSVRRFEPDVLINNAGINKNLPFIEIDPQDFQRIQNVNVFAPLSLCQAAIPGMRRKGWGRIVNISSIWGKVSKEHRASYSASKFALDGMTLALAAEHAADGILANCVAPGFTDTELTHKMLGDEGIRQILSTVPIRRMANVDEIARFVVWLGSPENTYITGQNIAIDGGFSRV